MTKEFHFRVRRFNGHWVGDRLYDGGSPEKLTGMHATPEAAMDELAKWVGYYE